MELDLASQSEAFPIVAWAILKKTVWCLTVARALSSKDSPFEVIIVYGVTIQDGC